MWITESREWGGEPGWFAYDLDGQVAVFWPHASGAVPRQLLRDDPEDAAYHQILEELRRVAEEDSGEDSGGEELDADVDAAEDAPSGVYVYWHRDEEMAGLYECEETPPTPVHVSSLAPSVVTGMVRFEGRFADRKLLQPVEHWRCVAPRAAWLASDERTVRCLPGGEETYADEVAALEPICHELRFELPRQSGPSTTRRWWQFWVRGWRSRTG